ncbi:MAG: glycosyltransferase [Bacteroides sp.]|nr:glycosyltransferase [Bacteroides sp.]MCM1084925.1 glycosyltransferase [Bacteroides sp.]
MDSILHQTYPLLELIVQDDCSTDNTCVIIQEYAAQYPFIQLYRNEEQLGINQNFLSAMQRAHGDFIALSDQDDIWMADKLEQQIKCIGQHDICASSYYEDAVHTDRMEKIKRPHLSLERRFFENDIPGHTMLVRKSLLETIQLPAPIFYDHWLVMCANFRNGITVVLQPLNWHRPHDSAATHFVSISHHHSNIFVPYINGFTRWIKLHRTTRWHELYHTFEEQMASNQQFDVLLKISILMQKKGLINLVRLSWLFTKHRKLFYPNSSKGLRSCIRAFFFPLMHAYYHYAEFTSWN